MTGNTSKWRAPLAGLASIAMLATMGVAAGTANAESAVPVDTNDNAFNVRVYSAEKPYEAFWSSSTKTYRYGDVFDLSDISDPFTSAGDGKVLTGYSYDLAGKNVAVDRLAVKGDTKLFAQYAKAYEVTFNVTGATPIDVKAGSAIDAESYYASNAESKAEAAAPAGQVFAGWTTSTHKDDQTLYTNGAINAATTLQPVYVDKGSENIARVELTDAQKGTTETKYTLADQAFPEFRANPTLKNAEWQQDQSGKAYDFTQPVKNAVRFSVSKDLKLFGVSKSSDKVWTVIYHFNGKNDSFLPASGKSAKATYGLAYTGRPYLTEAYSTADGKAVEPGTPAVRDAEFTGWYQSDNDKAFDFNTPVSAQAEAQDGSKTINLYAGWKTHNIVPVVYYYGYGSHATNSKAEFLLPTGSGETDAKGLTHRGKAINYQTAGTAIQQPTGLEDYFQTAADEDHGTYHSSKVTGWLALASDAPITSVTSSVSVYAKWSSASSILLDANGGTWSDTGANHTRYATKADGQTWQDVVTTPSREGYTFLFWSKNKADASQRANLFSGKYADGSDISEGDTLVANWAATANLKVFALHDNPAITGINKQDDYALYNKYGYTEASWKTYVDTWYGLQDEFFALGTNYPTFGQDYIDAANKLGAKYEAAQKNLVKSDAAEVPSGKAAVYRLYNPNDKGAGAHHYTTSQKEYDALQLKGWKGEGVFFYTTTSKKATPLYRVYNKHNGAHHYTTDLNEKNKLVKLGWTDEDVAFYVDASAPDSVYRAYNPNSGEHVYTASSEEYQKLTGKYGWQAENEAFKAWAK